MYFFDFHHHTPNKGGIYNLNILEKDYKHCYSVGLHPKDIPYYDKKARDWLEDFSTHKNCLAIGECGLDSLVSSDLFLQETFFKEQIEWANYINKPVIIHCVRQFHRLKSFMKIANTPLIVHGFNKNGHIAKELLNNGFYLSFGKALLHDVSLQEIFKTLPKRSFFLETDNSGLDIQLIYEKAAELKKIPIEEVNEIIHENLKDIKCNGD